MLSHLVSIKTALLVSILGAVSTTAYFSGRIYLLLAEQKAQSVSAVQWEHDFVTKGQPPPAPHFTERGL